MISYEPLWETMESRGITSYALIAKYGMSSHTIYNLRHNKSITMNTLEQICSILQCEASDVVKFI